MLCLKIASRNCVLHFCLKVLIDKFQHLVYNNSICCFALTGPTQRLFEKHGEPNKKQFKSIVFWHISFGSSLPLLPAPPHQQRVAAAKDPAAAVQGPLDRQRAEVVTAVAAPRPAQVATYPDAASPWRVCAGAPGCRTCSPRQWRQSVRHLSRAPVWARPTCLLAPAKDSCIPCRTTLAERTVCAKGTNSRT